MSITRRTFIAGSAATVAAPAIVAQAQSGDVDVAIVGAGAAGIAAARRVAAANRRFALVEASDRIGGRCITDTRSLGMPFDRGAHWIFSPDINPVAQAATRAGIDMYGAPPGQKVRVARRNAREGEMEDFLSALVRARRAIEEASRRADVSCARALPNDLGDWQRTVEFVLGSAAYGKDLSEMSSVDFTRAAERDAAAFSRIGFGGLLGKLAERIPVQLNTQVARIYFGKGGLEVETDKGRFSARAAIVTVSTSVLASGAIKMPELPRRHLDAAARLSLGSTERIALELAGNPLGLQRDDLVFEKASDARTGALLANISGTTLCTVDVAGRFGRELARQGEGAMVAFATDWLASLFGNDVKSALRRSAATQWTQSPFVLGASSVAAPGAQNGRRILMESIGGRLWIAGEAVHETQWGTVNGAWESGERAATEALKTLGALKEPEPEKKPAQPQRTRRRTQQPPR
jgi:monoamine oxidase